MVAAELVETSRLFARTVARIDPEEVERLADHLVKRHHSEPRWDAKRGSVVATERVTLYGLPLVVGRRVQYGSIDPVVSRELFIRHALVQGEWTTHHRFVADNARALQQVADLEERARRRDIRRRDGARQWALLRDLENPGQWSESYHIATWDDYVRHNLRRTKTDAEVTVALRRLHRGEGDPAVHRMIERHSVTPADDLPLIGKIQVPGT